LPPDIRRTAGFREVQVMSNTAATANVIQMRDFERPVGTQNAAQFERLLKECQEQALARLEKSLSAMLDKADEALWNQANASTDRDTRDLHYKAKDRIQAQRKVLEEQFRTHYLSEFAARSERGRKPADEFSKYDLSSLELNLVAEDDLDETLKTNEMAAKLRRYCDEELAALDQRVGVLIGDATLQGEANPFSPQAICTAFRHACKHVEPELKVRMVFHKLFDDHVLDDIRSIYKDLNALLVQRSILPKIRYGLQRAGGISPRAAAGIAAAAAQAGNLPLANAAAAAAAAGIGDAYASGVAGGGEQDFFAMLQGLMGLGAAAPRAAGADGAGGVQVPGFPPILGGAAAAGANALLEGRELLGSLTRMQHGDVSSIGGGNLPLAATLVAPGTHNVLRELKGTSFGTGLGHVDSMTLDIVIMLFDQIFDDRKIPSAMKGLIGRLQIPTLKVAILDKTFFSRKSHPARELLDALGDVALGLPADFHTSSPLFAGLDGVVQRLIDGFQDDIAIFEKARGELDSVLAEENKRAEAEARATAQRIEQKEKLEVARAVAQHAIKLRAESRQMPRAVLKFLSSQWVKLLLVAYAKHGADSDAYKTALATMDLLIWSVTPMNTLEERRQLAAKLPGLLKRINYGMQLVGTDEATRRTFFAKLMRCHTKVINGTGAAAPAASRAAPAVRAGSEPLPAAPAAQDPIASAGTRDDTLASAPAPAVTDAVAAATLAHENEPPLLTELAPPALPDVSRALEMVSSRPPQAEAVAMERLAAPVLEDPDTEPDAAPPEFAPVTIRNPFGEGEIEVEEIDMSDLPGLPGAAPLPGAGAPADGDEHGRLASTLSEGVWIEFRDDDDLRRPARLSYISPLKGTYLFVNRQGKKVGEYSLYQLAREFRTGRAAVLDEVPLFDRAMTSLVGVLKGAGKVH
jgi:exonuclease VII small subunit